MLSVDALNEWQVNLSLDADEVDLTNCDREPIHIPGSIQPHGLLLVLEPDSLQVIQASANVADFLGVSPEQLLNSSLARWFDASAIDALQRCLQQDFEHINPLRFTCKPELGLEEEQFDAIVHVTLNATPQVVIVELEPVRTESTQTFFDFYRFVKSPLDRIQRAKNLDELGQVITQEVQGICGFDRVMIYKFSEDGSGSVIAEARREGVESFFGLHYPASDIPRQAKKLYASNKLRIVPNCCYQPVPLVPVHHPLTHQPTDLSYSVLRSVSPIHLEYLANMGVEASMSISLTRGNSLWGLIACHHGSPHQVSYELRTVCEFIGQVAAIEIAAKEEMATLDYRLKIAEIQANLIQSIAQSRDLLSALACSELMSLVSADGAVIIQNDQQIHLGKTPQEPAIDVLLTHLEPLIGTHVVYQTQQLSTLTPEAAEYAATASGMLAMCIAPMQRAYILWFRQEFSQTVDWGGNPYKPMVEDEDGNLQIFPRKSFAQWTEIVRGQSKPWLACETELALELRANLLSLLLRNAEELAMVNRELSRSNDELDAFAYIASHDLKEPLRGIYNYSSFLIEDYKDQLDEEGTHKLETLMRLTKRMEQLIDSLLYFSRLGRVELNLQPVDLDDLLDDVLETFQVSRQTEDVEIKVSCSLPQITCDRVQVTELFTNLISNAIKYNANEKKEVEIGVLTGEDVCAAVAHHEREDIVLSAPLFFIRDNGIGIRQRHLKSIFRIFKRLHSPKRYGGGTGAGLTIVKKIVERHGGMIWVQSVYGEGSTFYFTLAEPSC